MNNYLLVTFMNATYANLWRYTEELAKLNSDFIVKNILQD